MEKQNIEQINEAPNKWTPDSFIQYYSKLYGTMTLDEFREYNMQIINERFPD